VYNRLLLVGSPSGVRLFEAHRNAASAVEMQGTRMDYERAIHSSQLSPELTDKKHSYERKEEEPSVSTAS
jgi:hypothetical protein